MFGWDREIKVDKKGEGLIKTTPKKVCQNPFGHRLEDIVHATALVVGELVAMEEAQLKAAQNRKAVLEAGNENNDA